MEEKVHAECMCTEVKRGPLSDPGVERLPATWGIRQSPWKDIALGVGPTEPQPKASLN